MLDADGEVVMRNAAWSALTEAGGAAIAVGPGVNYLAACDASGDPVAGKIATGLREIIAGARNGFALEYAGRASLAEARWFVLRGARYDGPGAARVVIARSEVSERRVAQAKLARERERSERELRAARNYLRAVADGMGEGLCTTDADGRVVFVNQAAESLLGWTRDSAKGRSLHELVHAGRPDGECLAEECPILQASRDGVAVRVEDDSFRRMDGQWLSVAYTAAPFVTDDGIDGCAVVFEDATERKARELDMERDVQTLSWIKRIRDGLAQDRFELYEQPILDLASGKIVQRELLLRLRETDGEIIGPSSFLPIAEQYGLIADIDRWVIERATEIAAEIGPVQINVSARSVGSATIVDWIERCLQRADVDPSLLMLEITETALIADEAAAKVFANRLHDLGCKLALDDFGTGYGGFTYLKQLPVDLLKIDIEFVRDLSTNTASRHVVTAVVALARAFGLRTVAEGVEDAPALEMLRDLGVDFAQGYHIARPAPVERVGADLASRVFIPAAGDGRYRQQNGQLHDH
ncbi:MAG TPA: EAL domain-containing protein [Solirubrobacteraceae bacterium]